MSDIKFEAEFIRETVRDYPGILAAITPPFLRDAAIAVQGSAKRLAPEDTGNLRGSISREVFHNRAEVGTNVEYAEYVEFGSGPHFPPLDAIKAWARRKGIPESAAYPIARKIAEEGVEEQPFLRPAIDENRRGLIRLLARKLREHIQRGT